MRLFALRTIALFLLALPTSALADATYVIKKGDSLAKIAKAHKVPVEKIMEANKLASIDLSIGQKLRIPKAAATKSKTQTTQAKSVTAPKNTKNAQVGKTAKAVKATKEEKTAKPKPTPSIEQAAQIHIIQSKDTLFALSRTYGVSEKEISKLNGLKTKTKLKLGSQLVIRKSLPETYLVAKGDTLEKIADRFGLDSGALAEINELDGSKLAIGKKLSLVDRSVPVAQVQSPEPAVSEDELREAAQPTAGAEGETESLPERVTRVAKMMLSTPYRFGGTTLKGIDCSGYVRKTFSFLDFELPRSAREQYRIGEAVSKSDLSVGDLVFFRTYAKYPSHVGIYLGNNQFIHASSRNHEVEIASLNLPYYQKRYIGAKRILAEESDEKRVM